jgi:hypothetical protein
MSLPCAVVVSIMASARERKPAPFSLIIADSEEVPRAPCQSIQSADQQRISFLQRCDGLGELASISNSAAYLLREYTLCASGS